MVLLARSGGGEEVLPRIEFVGADACFAGNGTWIRFLGRSLRGIARRKRHLMSIKFRRVLEGSIGLGCFVLHLKRCRVKDDLYCSLRKTLILIHRINN